MSFHRSKVFINKYSLTCSFVLISILVYYCLKSSVPRPSLLPSYDFIIVGGGTAGCVLSSLLSESGRFNVLLVEAGGEFGILSKIPLTTTMIQHSSNDWSFETTSQKYSSFGLNDEKQLLPKGKGLGGSGQLNYLLHDTGLPSDYENWVKMGAKQWSYSHLKPYFDKIFVLGDKSRQKNSKRPVIRLTNIDNKLRKITDIFLTASKQISSFNIRVQSFLNTIYNGVRESSYTKYLLPVIKRNNLHVLTNALVSKVNFIEKEARSIDVILENNESRTIMATNEIIISCGAIKTPQLLMLSGIGPKKHLEDKNIDVIVDSESVGKNLHDHLNMPIYVSIKKPISVTLHKIYRIKSIFDYIWSGEGYISSAAVAAMGRGPNNTSLTLFALGSTDETILRQIANTKVETFRAFFPFHQNKSQEGFVFLASCLQPSSRGTVLLKNNDPNEPPIIDPNYLSTPEDVECTIKALRMAIDIISAESFQDIGAVIHWPKIEECASLLNEDINDDYLECIIRYGALTGHHSAGTCKMAGDSPVVDEYLRVNGVKKLRIIDASVLPTPISSSTNSLIVALAERGHDIIINNKYN